MHQLLNHTHLCLVLTAPAFVRIGLEVGNSDETTEVTDVDLVCIRGVVETLMKKLSSAMRYLTISFHLAKPKTTIAEEGKEGMGILDHHYCNKEAKGI